MPNCNGFCNPLTVNTLEEFLYMILKTTVLFLFPVVVLMIVYTGFLFVRAQGNPGKIEEARRALLWTLVGGLVVLGAYAIAMVVKDTVDSITIIETTEMVV